MAFLDLKFFLDAQQHGYFATFIMGAGDAVLDNWLGTAMTISLGTNLRVDGVDRPDNGWWGEPLIGNFGSKLYLLDRSKAINKTLLLAEQYTEEAFQWLVDEGYLKAITDVIGSYLGDNRVQLVTVYETFEGEFRKHLHIFSLDEGA